MINKFWQYRLAGLAGGLMLAAGLFYSPLSVLQLGAFVPVMMLSIRDKQLGLAAMAGFYMGLIFTLPQMIYLRMPVTVTAALLVEFTLMLVLLNMLACGCCRGRTILGYFAFGAGWMLLDWLNYTAIPIWGMAQTFARGWTAYPWLIGFIAITGISGVVFAVGAIQALAVRWYCDRPAAKPAFYAMAALVGLIAVADILPHLERPAGTLRVAAAGWIFDDLKKTNDPHTEDGFQTLFAKPAAKAAAEGAKLFTTGEMGFYIANHTRSEWMERFAHVAQSNHLYLMIGYFNITADENRLLFMNPDGEVVTEYTKTHLTPYEPGKKGTGDLKTLSIDGVPIGGMICQDNNFSQLTRYYGQYKTPLIVCPTADWWTIKNAHLQAVRARAIECHYAIARGAANGISAIIAPDGRILAKRDHYAKGPGYVIADMPLYHNITLFARFGHWPMVITAMVIICVFVFQKPYRKQ